MRRLSYLIDGKAVSISSGHFIFGSDDPGGDSGGGAGEDIVTMGVARHHKAVTSAVVKKWP